MGEIIFHLALAGDWGAARAAGEYRISTRGLGLEEVGFIHCSRAGQVAGVAERFYGGAGPLVLLYVDRDRVRAEVRDDPVPGGEVFPHIYGPLPVDAVIATTPTDPARAADPSWASAASELVVGVSGHRHLADPDGTGAAVAAVAGVLSERSGTAGWRLVSALAEGADRIAAHAALAAGAALDVVLPLPAEDYRGDFGDDASRAEFDDLLARADSVAVTGDWPDGTRTRAYANAGSAMLGRCHVLLGLWDGEPARGEGGTAEVVAAALASGVETIVVPTHRAGTA